MNRLSFFIFRTILSACLAVVFSASPASAQPPNVLFIAVDDLNDWVSVCGGHPQAKTPHLERFVDSGAMVFQNAHCPGPVCGPSRSALLSGFMPSRTGIYGNSQNMRDAALVRAHATLPEYFSKHGYVTLSMGKIFHKHATPRGSDEGHWAFDQWERALPGSGVDRKKITSRDQNLIHGKAGPPTKYSRSGGSEFAWGPTVGGKAQTRDYRIAQWAAEQFSRNYEKPFFLAVGISRPHLPFFVPQEFFDLYDPETFRAPEIRENDLDDIVKSSRQKKFKPSDDYLWLKENGLIDEAARAYMAACSYADACLGVIFEGLEKSGHAEDTVVMVWGDHGWHLGEKLRYRKATGWSESTRVPLLVRLPEMKIRQDCERAVNLIDLYPTLIEVCGLPTKPELDGRSFGPLLADPTRNWKHAAVTVMGHGAASVRDGRWRYLIYSDGTEELYDLDADPMEWTNLLVRRNPERKAMVKKLQALLPQEFADPVPSPGREEMGKLKKKAKTLDDSIAESRDLGRLR